MYRALLEKENSVIIITNDNKDYKQTIRILKQNHTTSAPHLTKQCKICQLQWFYSQQQPRYRRRSIRSKSQQRYLRRSTNIISNTTIMSFNPLNAELNPICYLLALLVAHHFLHVSRIRVKLLTFRLLMSYIYGAPILDVSRSHTTTQHSR